MQQQRTTTRMVDVGGPKRALKQRETVSVWQWLRQGGPHDPKHASWPPVHAVVTCLLHYTIVATVSIHAHDASLAYYQGLTISGDTECHHDAARRLEPRRHAVALWFVVYVTFVLVWRLLMARSHARSELRTTKASKAAFSAVWYEYCWLCNVALWMAAVALGTHRPILAQAYAVTIGIDQLLWYVDALSYATTGTFAVGVAKYLTWPGNTDWTSRLTCTHHLWTIPLILYASGCGEMVLDDATTPYSVGGMHSLACPLSFVCMTINVLVSRWCTPSHVVTFDDSAHVSKASGSSSNLSSNDPPQATYNKYLNVNVSHALWKDIQFDVLQIDYDDPPVWTYLRRLLWRWQAFNTIIFGVLWMVCRPWNPGVPLIC